ncbi:MAG: hypothetical protein IKL71_00035 [Bacteroidaceae bacterium]|nr:hypothetical protein [Bacteroidaceae bacterium]
MKKYFVTLFLSVFCFVVQVSAQSSVIATLFHDGDIKTFYGTGALRNAHAAAVHGDVITLSSGSFTATDITKAVTLRGAGMEYDSISVIEPTIISGDFSIQIASDSTLQNNNLVMEGIYHNADGTITVKGSLKNPQFVKCRLYEIRCSSASGTYGSMHYANFINCVIASEVEFYSSGSATFVNCYVNNLYQYYSGSSHEFQNCVVNDANFAGIPNTVFRNCFLYASALNTSSYNKLPSTSPAYNCVALSATSSTNIFANQSNTTNTQVSSFRDVFKTWQGSFLANFKAERLELTDAAKTKYLGSDGTQIGIYGGSIPFDPRPSNPQITKLNVASKSTADGKLSVDIEVKAAE